jgi:hypothetical protein
MTARVDRSREDLTEREQARDLMIKTEKMTAGWLPAWRMRSTIRRHHRPNLHNIERRLALDSPDNQEVAEELGINDADPHLPGKGSVLKLLATMYRPGTSSQIISNMLQFSRKSGSERRLAVLPDIIDTPWIWRQMITT